MFKTLIGCSLLALSLKEPLLLPNMPVSDGVRRYARNCIKGFPANINRNTGRPHEHKREIARRLRQERAK